MKFTYLSYARRFGRRLGAKVRPFITAMAVIACGTGAALAEKTEVTVVLPGSSAIAWYPMIVAQQRGFFAEQGLKVTIRSLDGSGAVIQAMESGRAEFGAPGPGPAINAYVRGADIKYFYNLFSRGLFVIAGDRADKLKGAADLKGRKIGVSTADGAEVSFTRTALATVGLTPKDYKFVTIGQEGMAVTALHRDTIHAFAASFTGVAVLKDRGVDVIDLTPAGLELFGNGLAVRGDIYRNKPQLVAAFTRAIHKASLFGQKNPEAVLDDGATYNPQEIERRAYARTLLAAVIQQYKPFPDHAPGYLPESGWRAWHESLLETGELDKPVADLSALYTNEFVEKLGGR